MERFIKKANLIIGLIFVFLGSVFIFFVKGYETFHMNLFFEGSSISYFAYLLFKNTFLIGFFIIGLGIIMFINQKKTKVLFLFLFFIIMTLILIDKNTKKTVKDFKPFLVDLQPGYSDRQLISFLEKNGFEKVKRKIELDEYGEPKKDNYYYPYYFIKTDSLNLLKYSIQFRYYRPINYEDNDMKSLISNITMYISQEKDKKNNSYDYLKFKRVFNYYFCLYKSEYSFKPYVNYPYLRTFSSGSYGQGSSFSISRKEDLISFTWANNDINKSTSLTLNGSTGDKLGQLSRDNVVVNVKEENMYIIIEQSVYSYYYKKDHANISLLYSTSTHNNSIIE